MDLLFNRYASPLLLVDTLIQTNSLSGFITDMQIIVAENKQWEFFLHKVYDQSWNEFKESMKSIEIKPVDLGATMNKSKEMLKNFIPKGSE